MQAPSAPRSGDKLDLNTVKGRLLHIQVAEIVRDIETAFGKSDAVRATVAILDGDQKGTVLEDVLFFPRVLRSQLEQALGETVLARLGQGTAKPGKSAPWILEAASDADLETGTKYEAHIAAQAAAQEEPF
jgi:hypothetical protein